MPKRHENFDNHPNECRAIADARSDPLRSATATSKAPAFARSHDRMAARLNGIKRVSVGNEPAAHDGVSHVGILECNTTLPNQSPPSGKWKNQYCRVLENVTLIGRAVKSPTAWRSNFRISRFEKTDFCRMDWNTYHSRQAVPHSQHHRDNNRGWISAACKPYDFFGW